MFKNVVISDISAPWIRVVVNVIHTEPVIDPTFSVGISNLGAERVVHNLGQHPVYFVPGVVVGEKGRIQHFLDRRLQSAERYFSSLELAQQNCAGLQIELKDIP
jgi:hypothetical protein